MTPTRKGSFHLFRLFGIDVHLHWSWFIVAFYSISIRVPNYENFIWAVGEYLTLFLVVLMHEFGHSLACRQVGGTSDQIVLWPLGGVAYVAPPARPGATLWSIAAGPLVNVALLPIFWGMIARAHASGALGQNHDLLVFLRTILLMDISLLVLNLLPIYPLDGGQILRALLWYPFGKARSLMAATVIGLIGGAGVIGVAIWLGSVWFGFIAFFLLSNCWQSFRYSRQLLKLERLPRRSEFKCPVCHASPPSGDYWRCPQCHQTFDPFASSAQCPHCQAILDVTTCPDCGSARPQRSWDASIREG